MSNVLVNTKKNHKNPPKNPPKTHLKIENLNFCFQIHHILCMVEHVIIINFVGAVVVVDRMVIGFITTYVISAYHH
jgi:hypothetical protein